ncbi:glycosyltransferase family 2 protein, partial [Staphylococcus aureus]|uniref:glycosyltransferase family 2 protein n=1 Tax=Staphylococcus aureus TaxID=1280 RepID=UPI003A80A6BD
NSKDDTQKVLQKLNVTGLLEKKVGPGAARQLGQEHARGQYVLSADADCIYPPTWLDTMMETLRKPGVTCVYGRYSFMESGQAKRHQLFVYE